MKKAAKAPDATSHSSAQVHSQGDRRAIFSGTNQTEQNQETVTSAETGIATEQETVKTLVETNTFGLQPVKIAPAETKTEETKLPENPPAKTGIVQENTIVEEKKSEEKELSVEVKPKEIQTAPNEKKAESKPAETFGLKPVQITAAPKVETEKITEESEETEKETKVDDNRETVKTFIIESEQTLKRLKSAGKEHIDSLQELVKMYRAEFRSKESDFDWSTDNVLQKFKRKVATESVQDGVMKDLIYLGDLFPAERRNLDNLTNWNDIVVTLAPKPIQFISAPEREPVKLEPGRYFPTAEQRSRWSTMSAPAIVSDLGWSWNEVEKLFLIKKGDATSAKVGAYIYIKQRIMSGWTPKDGTPRIVHWTGEDGIIVIDAWKFELAGNYARNQLNMVPDTGRVFRWNESYLSEEENSKEKHNVYAVQDKPFAHEEDYQQARKFHIPFKGDFWKFKQQYGTFDNYIRAVEPAKAAAKSVPVPQGKKIGTPEVGLISDPGKNGGANLRSSPETEKGKIIEHLAFNTRVFIQFKTSKGWYYVTTESGEKGYVAAHLVETRLPASDAKYYLVKKGDTALGIARRFYSSYSKENIGQVQMAGQDFRNYVLKLAAYNKGGGISFPSNPGNEPAWKNVIVKEGMRIWIPSSFKMYELVKKTPSKDLYGQHSFINTMQKVLDYSPGSMMINYFLEEWRKIPAKELAANMKFYIKIVRNFLTKLRINTPAWLDAILALTPFYALKSLMSFITEFQIGYLDYLLTLDSATLVNSLERFIYSQTQVDYYIGLITGIGEGIAGWFTDIIDLFTTIGSFIGEIFNVEANRQRALKMGIGIAKIVEYISSKDGQAKLFDMLKSFNPLDLFNVIDVGIKAAGRKVGWNTAGKVIAFMNQPPYGVGKSIGYVVGYLIPEILLLVFTTAIGNGIKWGMKALRVLLEGVVRPLLQGLRVVVSLLSEAIGTIGKIVGYIADLIRVLAKSGKDTTFFRKIQEFIESMAAFFKTKVDDAIIKGKKEVSMGDEAADATKAAKDEVPKKTEKSTSKKEEIKEKPEINPKSSTSIDDKVKDLPQEKLFGDDALTFIDNEYRTVETIEEVVVYRDIGGGAKVGGSFSTTSAKATRNETAILDSWGNTMEFKVEIKIPPKSKLNIGKAGSQPLAPEIPIYTGGADQVILPYKWSEGWITKIVDNKTGKIFTLDEFKKIRPDLF